MAQSEVNETGIGFEDILWTAADKWRCALVRAKLEGLDRGA